MKKPLIAVMTCFARRAYADAQRDTWVRDVVERGIADVRFFLGARHFGSTAQQRDDEVWLEDVRDDYRGIPQKVRGICRWMCDHEYDIVAKCDDDVYVVPGRLPVLPSGGDYIGRFRGPYGTVYPVHFASGFFYSLKRRAAQVVADTPWNGDWMDERFVATALAHKRIFGVHDPVNYLVTAPHAPFEIASREHLRKGTAYCEYAPPKMHAMHLTFRHMTPVVGHPGLVHQPAVPVTDAILCSPPGDDVPAHKLGRYAC